jgi:hypothetical protein
MKYASTAPTTRPAGWQSPLPSPQSTYEQAEVIRAEEARFDAVLAKILRQQTLVREHTGGQTSASRQTSTGIQTSTGKRQKKVADKTEEENDWLQKRTQDPEAQSEDFTRVALCTHQFHWTDVAGRSRCEWHLYSPKSYRNPFRSRCPACRTIACGLCRKKLKRGDALLRVWSRHGRMT